MAGNGVFGKVVGIAHVIITGTGVIIIMFQVFILMKTQVGEDTTEIVNGFLTNDFKRTGAVGKRTDIGKGKKFGASRAINLDHTHSLKGNLKDGMQNIESRMTKSLKKLPFIMSFGI